MKGSTDRERTGWEKAVAVCIFNRSASEQTRQLGTPSAIGAEVTDRFTWCARRRKDKWPRCQLTPGCEDGQADSKRRRITEISQWAREEGTIGFFSSRATGDFVIDDQALVSDVPADGALCARFERCVTVGNPTSRDDHCTGAREAPLRRRRDPPRRTVDTPARWQTRRQRPVGGTRPSTFRIVVFFFFSREGKLFRGEAGGILFRESLDRAQTQLRGPLRGPRRPRGPMPAFEAPRPDPRGRPRHVLGADEARSKVPRPSA